jgi:two-component system, NtrC family, sensor kinase
VTSGAACIAVVAYGGGTEGARFGFLLAFPLAVLVLFPEFPISVGVLGVTCLLGGVALVFGEGRDGWFAFEWAMLSFALSVLAVLGSIAFQRLWLSQLRAQHSRAEALQRLGESERRRAQSERLALMGSLAAGVAHEINTPLAYVKSNVRSLRGESLPEETRLAIDDALEGIERIAQIVSDLRGLAREGPTTLEPVSVEEVLGEAWRLASLRFAKVNSTWSVEPGLPRVAGNHRLLVQALVNLATNAADAASSSGDPASRWVSATAARLGGEVVIHVDDGGPGISQHVSEHLFEPFVSTKGADGTGLGLTLVREHVARCGGTVEGGNRKGGGARFTIILPVAPSERGPLGSPLEVRMGPDSQKRRG